MEEIIDLQKLAELKHQSESMMDLKLRHIQKAIKEGKSEKVNDLIGIPKRYREVGIYNTTISDTALSACVQDLRSIYLTGATGAGKTHLACYLALHYYAAFMTEREDGEIYPSKISRFLIMPRLLAQIKTSWETKEGYRETEEQLMERCKLPNLLVIDDIAANKLSEWSKDVVYNIINERYLDMKQTIVTSNLTLGELSQQFDDRIASRIADGVIIDCGKKDWRVSIKIEIENEDRLKA